MFAQDCKTILVRRVGGAVVLCVRVVDDVAKWAQLVQLLFEIFFPANEELEGEFSAAEIDGDVDLQLVLGSLDHVVDATCQHTVTPD